MRHTIAIIALLVAASPLYAQMYKWTDADGRVHFSDQPHDNSSSVQLNKGNSFSGEEASERNSRAARTTHQTVNSTRKRPATPSIPSWKPPVSSSSTSKAEVQKRIENCKSNRHVDCSESTITKQINEDRYRQTPAGQAQQEAIRQRKGMGW